MNHYYRIAFFFKNNYKILKIIIAILLLFYGGYIVYSLIISLFEDIYYNFEILRLVYTWDQSYASIYTWINALFCVLGGTLILFSKTSKFLVFLFIGYILFFMYIYLNTIIMIHHLIMMIFCVLYYNHLIKNSIYNTKKDRMIYLIIHIMILIVSINAYGFVRNLIEKCFV